MSDTPKLADECKKLLDNGWSITLFKCELGSYAAKAVHSVEGTSESDPPGSERIVITDDFEPSQALYRITEKVLGNIA